GYQFLGRKLISWQCKKQTIVATSTTEAEYVAAASCCGQVLWIQNQLLDYGDCFKKKLICMDHIHTYENVADLLTKPFDAGRFQYLVCKIFPLLGQFSTVSVFLGFELTFAGTFKYWGVLRILMIGLRLIPLFWSTARIETIEEGTKILATVDGKLKTVSESSIRRNLKLNDETGISSLPDTKARIKLLEDKDRGVADQSGDDAPIKGRRLDEGEEAAERVMVPTAVEVATATVSIPTGSEVVSTASPIIPTAALIFNTATESTPYTRRKGKEKMIARDAKVARIRVEKELQMMINSLDKSNETVVKYLQEYEQIPKHLSIGERIELISDLVKYQENYAQVLKYQTLQRKLRSKKQKKDYYMAVIKGQAGWKTKDFKGMSFEQIEAKFNTVWKQIEDFILMGSKEEAERFKRKGLRLEQESAKKLKTSEEVPEEVKSTEEVPEEKVKEMIQLIEDFILMGSKEEAERFKRKGLRLEQESAKKLKTSEEVLEEVKSTEEVPEEKVKEMIQLVLVEEIYVEALQVKHPIIDWKHLNRDDLNQLWGLVKESLSIRPATSDKEMELWVELKRLYEPDVEDQLNKMHKAFPLSVMEFPLLEEVPTASEESSHCQKKRDAPAEKIALLLKSSSNYQSKSYNSYAKLVPHV
nr:putative ribonuclease H-like domain-containing protein [Tanacetum cinerariifolium]